MKNTGECARFVQLDVIQDDSWTEAVASAEKEFGPVTILVNNAGVVQWKPWSETTTAEWHRFFDINLTGRVYRYT